MSGAESLALGGDQRVCRLGFGAMAITGPGTWGEPRDPPAARAVLRQAVDLGVDFIDTADSYGPEVSERLIAEALRPYPPELVIATKGGYSRPGPGRWQPDGRPDHLRRACDGSLRRLGLEQLPLYQLHAVDRSVPFDDSVGALAELRQEGKIGHIGLSNVSVAHVERARAIAPIVSVQNRYNLADRGAADVLELCEQHGLAFICWSPLGRGALTRASGALGHAAQAHRADPGQVALAWLLQHSPATIAIPGTASAEHLAANMEAARIRLTEEEVRALGDFRWGTSETLRRLPRTTARRAAAVARRYGRRR